mmetsp:Transcript_39854/g.71837  ORF Transcript_39854/g.71837 Transcript_39854/m.71837 type:complete len:124 (+) Transcript_39854:940-1311(+)
MTQQSATKGHPILAHAPPDAPIHNRRHDSAALGATAKNEPSPQQPMFLSFTRYIVQSVQDHLATYTKTIAVSLWKSSSEEMGNNDKNDELERLKKICGRRDGQSNAVGSNNSSTMIDGYMYLR